jgi:3-oxoacyl-[acyl-carrier-protein] synthase-1
MPRVFITGLGFVTSIGNDAATVVRHLRELRHGFEVYPPFQKPDIPCKVIGTIKEFNTDSADPEDWTFPAAYKIRREMLRSMAPNGLFAHCAMLQAIADGQLTRPTFPTGRPASTPPPAALRFSLIFTTNAC